MWTILCAQNLLLLKAFGFLFTYSYKRFFISIYSLYPRDQCFKLSCLQLEDLSKTSQWSIKRKKEALGIHPTPHLTSTQQRSSSLFSVRGSCLEKGSFVEDRSAETRQLTYSCQRYIHRKGSLQHSL